MNVMLFVGVGIFCLLVLLMLIGQARTGDDTTEPNEEEVSGEPGDGMIEIGDVIDLHHFQPRDILSVVEAYLEAAAEKGFTEVRLIHGRGKGVQRRHVQELLENHPLVESYGDAPSHRGGWGATIARLNLDALASDAPESPAPPEPPART
jgi:dsDNA-specific endonuclease/ATPase MutS2